MSACWISAWVCGFLFAATPVQAATVGADAAVLVNSHSAKYLDFQHYIQPYLDNFGVPYTVLDISTNTVGANIGTYALIIIGHSQLDTSHAYLDSVEQGNISMAVSNGTGLVNFDNSLSTGSTPTYQFEQDIFGFSYGSTTSGGSVVFPPTEPSSQMHYITSLHVANESLGLSNNMSLANLTLPANATAVAQSGSKPFLTIRKVGQGRAVQWSSYDWMAVSVMGPVNGLDDLVWRGFVWAARKPFVLRGMPNFATMRVDDVGGPFTWLHSVVSVGFKPYTALFISSIAESDAADLRGIVTNGNATASIHSFTGSDFFYFDHNNGVPWSDSVMNNNFAIGTAWHNNHGIPISKMMIGHYSEIGPNAFAGMKAWGMEYVLIEIVPGTIEYGSNPSAWLRGGPYRLYETPLLGESLNPMVYADFLAVPGHPELDGQFFNPYTEIRNVAVTDGGGDWAPDNNVSGSTDRAVKQIKRGFDSLTLGNVFTHERFILPIANATWLSILKGVTNGLAAYKPLYVTMDYANQYLRATRTSRIVSSSFDPNSGLVTATLTGKTDLPINYYVFLGADSSISNSLGTVPVFSGSTTSTVGTPVATGAPIITAQPATQSVLAGSYAGFSVTASGAPPLSYQWQRNGSNLTDGGNLSGASSSALGLANVQPTDSASFRVIIANSLGAVTSVVAVLTVNQAAPTVTSPASQSVFTGANVTFTVTASGTAPLSYQWHFNGTNLADGGQFSGAASATLSLNNAQPANAGGYSVVVSNAVGSVTSAVATLTTYVPGSCSTPAGGLVGWWPGDGNGNDLVAGNNAVLQGGATTAAAGWVGQAFSFDGTNSYVQIPDAAALKPTNFTIEAWVRFASLDSAASGGSPAGDQYIVFKQNTRSADFEGIDLSKTRVAGGDVFRLLVSSATAQTAEIHSSTFLAAGVWYHVAAVRGTNFTQLYVNGQLERQTNVTFSQNYGTLPLYFGTSGQSSWDHRFKGSLDEVSLYNRALAANEIAAIYASGSGGKCKVIVSNPPPAAPAILTPPTNQTATADGNVTFTVTASGIAPLAYQWRKNGGNVSGATSSTLTLLNVQSGDAANYQVVVTNVAGAITSVVAVLTVNGAVSGNCYSAPAGLAGWWAGDGNGNDLAAGNNGTLQGSAAATAAGLVGQAFSFDGTNSFVQIPDSAALKPTNFTIEAWVRFASLDSAGSGGSPAGDQYIVFKQNTRSGDFEGYDLSKTRVAGGDVFRFLISSATAQTAEIHSSTFLTTGVWYHVAAVRAANFTQLYVNGQLQHQTNVAFAQNYGTLPLYFGTSGQSAWDHKLKGNLDEVSLYNRALASNEIAAIYAAGSGGKCKGSGAQTIVAQPTPPNLSALNRTPDGSVHFTINATPGLTWQIEASTNLVDWETLTNIASPNGTFEFIDLSATNFSRRFYRALLAN